MGSDGLFDNVFDHEIVSMTTRFIDVSEAGICSVFGSIYQNIIYSVAQWFTDWDFILMLAKALANLACSHSTDSNFDSPYTMEARAKVKS